MSWNFVLTWADHEKSFVTSGPDLTYHIPLNPLPVGYFFSCFFVVCWYIFFKISFFKKSIRNTVSVSNRLAPDQAGHVFLSDLGLICLQRLWADNTSRQRVNKSTVHIFWAHLSRRLRGELLVYEWLCPSVNIFKHLLLWNNHANWTQISYGDSLGWRNKSLFKWSWSHGQGGRNAHIW